MQRARLYSTLNEQVSLFLKTRSNQFQSKVKGTIFEKWLKYWKQLAKDYKDVGVQIKQDIKDRPLRATVYFTGAGLIGLCAATNPNLHSFRAKYIECANDVGLVSQSLRNEEASRHLKHIERCFNTGRIRYTSFGIASIVWVDKFSDECDIYETNCSYLQVPYTGVMSRVLDVGFINTWWVISRKMLDYDINY